VKELISESICQLRVSRCNSARLIVENFDIVSSVVCKVVRMQELWQLCLVASVNNAVVTCDIKLF